MVSIVSAADEHQEHMKTMKSIRLRASRLMNIDVIHPFCYVVMYLQ